MSFCVHAASIPAGSNYSVGEFQGNLLMLCVEICHLFCSRGKAEVTFHGLGVILLVVSIREPTFALGQVAVETQRAYKLKEEDGDGCDDEQHHKHHHPNRCTEGL